MKMFGLRFEKQDIENHWLPPGGYFDLLYTVYELTEGKQKHKNKYEFLA